MATERIVRKKARPGRPSFEVGGCRIASLVTVDDRGQMVLPKEVRERAGLRAGEKLAVITCESHGKISCITLVRAEELGDLVKGFLGPLLKGLAEP